MLIADAHPYCTCNECCNVIQHQYWTCAATLFFVLCFYMYDVKCKAFKQATCPNYGAGTCVTVHNVEQCTTVILTT